MNARQKDFCIYYTQLLNATKAAIKAGYSKKTAMKTGSENLKKPELKNFIADLMSKKDKEKIMSADEALEILTKAARGELTDEVILVVDHLIERVEKRISLKEQIKAVENILKIHGKFEPKNEETKNKENIESFIKSTKSNTEELDELYQEELKDNESEK